MRSNEVRHYNDILLVPPLSAKQIHKIDEAVLKDEDAHNPIQIAPQIGDLIIINTRRPHAVNFLIKVCG